MTDLSKWWMALAADELADAQKKAAEYGSNSLEQVGRKVAALKGIEVTSAQALELGCWFYTCGKMERWSDAVLKGQSPSDDTLTDLKTYVQMAQRIRESGDWPGPLGVERPHDPVCLGIGKPCCSADFDREPDRGLSAGPDGRTL